MTLWAERCLGISVHSSMHGLKSLYERNTMTDVRAETRLMHAIIHQAVIDEKALDGDNQRFTADRLAEMGDPERWLRSYDTRPFSFAWYCWLMGCRPDKMRKAIIDKRDNGANPRNMHAADTWLDTIDRSWNSTHHKDDCLCLRCTRQTMLGANLHGDNWFARQKRGKRCGND